MNRRTFLCGLTFGTLVAPLVIDAQTTVKVWRIGVVASGVPRERIAALRDGLRELGYVEGQNIVIDLRWIYARQPDAGALGARRGTSVQA